jgi:hypothetical protein
MYSVPYHLLASGYTENIAAPAKWVPACPGMATIFARHLPQSHGGVGRFFSFRKPGLNSFD